LIKNIGGLTDPAKKKTLIGGLANPYSPPAPYRSVKSTEKTANTLTKPEKKSLPLPLRLGMKRHNQREEKKGPFSQVNTNIDKVRWLRPEQISLASL